MKLKCHRCGQIIQLESGDDNRMCVSVTPSHVSLECENCGNITQFAIPEEAIAK